MLCNHQLFYYMTTAETPTAKYDCFHKALNDKNALSRVFKYFLQLALVSLIMIIEAILFF